MSATIPPPQTGDIAAFIDRWAVSGGSEQANAQLFLAEFCKTLDLVPPEPAKPTNEENVYSFERKVYLPRGDGTAELKRLDLYKLGCFVLEAKQGRIEAVSTLPLIRNVTQSTAVKRGTRAWEDAMARAKRQAEMYIRALPFEEGRPPFLIVADVGFCFDLHAEFSCSGGMYIPFPDQRGNRIFLQELTDPDVQALFRTLWNDPHSLDPSRRAAQVTREIAGYLADLARSLEADGHSPERVSEFLMRCLFSMFAEDVGLLPNNSLTHILERAASEPELLPPMLTDLWQAMNTGAVSVALGLRLRRFNGNIFAHPEVLLLKGAQIAILIKAARADWRDVEPSIFGTLLERALSPEDRHALGAHYTPRSFVERLVLPTIITPLRRQWQDVQAAAALLATQQKSRQAQALILDFHRALCAVRVLDPACGSGNFLYVTLEHMKRLEGEVLHEAATYGPMQNPLEAEGLTVDPHQFLGLELNPLAAHIAEMVLWIGHLQWHFRTHGQVTPKEPLIRTFRNIQGRDALLERRDDGLHPAAWPEADFIVGNPPFIGGGVKRSALGADYFQALTAAYPELPEACDFVMYWWHKAASLVRAGKVRRFGFITTNSLGQVFNRRITAKHLEGSPPLRLAYVIPDHPWVDAADGADVRIAMSVGALDTAQGCLARVIAERYDAHGEIQVELAESYGAINPNLTIGVNVASAVPLQANEGLSSPGVKLHGSGFIVTPEEATALGLGRIPGLERHVRQYRNGKDIAQHPRGVMVIDLFGLTEEEVRTRFPEVYQRLYDTVKPERDTNNRKSYRENWWIFGEPRSELRPALEGLPRYIATPETAKHRYVVFLDAGILPDNKLVNIALDDAFHLCVLSSRVHCAWALAAGGRLGVGNDPVYIKSMCFDTFPFPDPTPEQKVTIRALGERLDAFRKERQALHPDLTMTAMYNLLEALRADRELTPAARKTHELALGTILRQMHDALDEAVAEAYGWADLQSLPDEEILERLLLLNQARAAEEAQGLVRWLRPQYQCRTHAVPETQIALDLGARTKVPASRAKQTTPVKLPWPKDLPAQFQTVRAALASLGGSADLDTVAKALTGARKARVRDVLETLALQGFVRVGEDGMYRGL